KTDSGPVAKNALKPDYIENLFQLMRLVSTPETVQSFDNDFNACQIRYGDMKKQLAEDMVRFISPIRERATSIYNDTAYLKQVVEKGAVQARDRANETIQMARE